MNINTATIAGNLTRDPELRYSEGGTAMATFSVAVNRYRSGEKVAHFFDCKAFGKTAESVSQYLKKGSGVGVVGRLEQDRWEGKDGSKRSKVVIIANEVSFGARPDGGSNSGSGRSPADVAGPEGVEEEIPF